MQTAEHASQPIVAQPSGTRVGEQRVPGRAVVLTGHP